MKIEMIFGGILALLVVAAAAFFMINASGSGSAQAAVAKRIDPIDAIGSAGGDVICQCYDAAFDLAGRAADVAGRQINVMNSRYETGYSQCRAIGDRAGADAWTAGWNAQLAKKPYEGSCRRYRQLRKRAG